MSDLPYFLTDIKGFVCFVTNQHGKRNICHVCSYQVLSDRCNNYSSNWIHENHVFFHLCVYIATIIANLYMKQKVSYVIIPVECFTIIKVHADESVSYIQEKNLKGDNSNPL